MAPEGSKIHFVQTVMLHIKLKVMKSRIQSCKHFAPGGGGGGGGGALRGWEWGALEGMRWHAIDLL